MATTQRRRLNAQPGMRARLSEIRDRAFDMEVPLTEAMEFVQALQMIGEGMVAGHNDEGRPISAVARAAAERLGTLKSIWLGVIKPASRRTAA